MRPQCMTVCGSEVVYIVLSHYMLSNKLQTTGRWSVLTGLGAKLRIRYAVSQLNVRQSLHLDTIVLSACTYTAGSEMLIVRLPLQVSHMSSAYLPHAMHCSQLFNTSKLSQLSQTDHATVAWVSFGQKWKMIFCRHYEYRPIFDHSDVIGIQSYRIRWNNAK